VALKGNVRKAREKVNPRKKPHKRNKRRLYRDEDK
jgi:hypothetical protein